MRLIFLSAMGFLMSACSGGARMPTAAEAGSYVAAPTQPSPARQGDYVIGAGDILNVRVFQVPDLSADKMLVDSQGDLQMPLLGNVRAEGLTTTELAQQLEQQLGRQYLRRPQVTVAVSEAASQKVTVDGAVTKPGVYELRGRTTLLQAVAMAEGPSPTADLDRVAVFRTTAGERTVAVFDLAAIRAGLAADPVIFGDDTVVVDASRLRSVLRDVVTALPAFAVFTRY